MSIHILTETFQKADSPLKCFGRRGDKVDLLGSDGHTATVKHCLTGLEFTCDMANLKADSVDDFLSNELELK